MRSAIVVRVRDRNPMEVADDLGHRFWRLLRSCRLYDQNLLGIARRSSCSQLAKNSYRDISARRQGNNEFTGLGSLEFQAFLRKGVTGSPGATIILAASVRFAN